MVISLQLIPIAKYLKKNLPQILSSSKVKSPIWTRNIPSKNSCAEGKITHKLGNSIFLDFCQTQLPLLFEMGC